MKKNKFIIIGNLLFIKPGQISSSSGMILLDIRQSQNAQFSAIRAKGKTYSTKKYDFGLQLYSCVFFGQGRFAPLPPRDD